MERCESLGRMLERVCCGPASLDDAALAQLLFLSRYFAALRDAAYSNRLARLISEPSRCRSAEEKSYVVRLRPTMAHKCTSATIPYFYGSWQLSAVGC
jgi:hypothetical protein